LLIALLATGVLFGVNEFVLKNQVKDLQTKKDQVSIELARLQQREKELRAKATVEQNLMQLIENAQIRNRVYVALLNDLRRKTPSNNAWIYAMDVNNRVRLKGKSLSHQAVIDLARSFDNEPYIQAVLIDSMKETMLHGNRVFDFEVGGNVRLNPALLQAAPAVADVGRQG